MRNSKKLLVSSLVCLALALTGCSAGNSEAPDPGASDEPIRIGTIFPLSGPNAQGGQRNMDGIQAAVDQVNESGGVNGRQVVVISTDAPDPAAAVANANRLITQDNVDVILGSLSSDLALAIAPVAERNDTIFWELQAVTNSLTESGFKYVFRTVAPASGLGKAAADYALDQVAAKLGKSKDELRIAVMNVDGAYGQDTTKGVLETLKKSGVTPVDVSTYDAKIKDLTPVILKQKDAKADVVISTSYGPDTILYMKQAGQLDFVPAAYIGTGAGQTTAAFKEGVGDASEGILSAASPGEGIDPSLLNEIGAKNLETYHSILKKNNTEPSQGTILAYIGTLNLLVDVLPNAKSMSAADVREAALSVDIPAGTSINGWGLKFSEEGQNELATVIVVQWQGDKMVTVFPDDLVTGSLVDTKPRW